MQSFNPVRGTYDYLPAEAKIREQVRQIILDSYTSNGYNLISTPVLEGLNFLNSSEGGENLRLMFKTIKRGDKLDLSKPNLTEADIVEEGLRYDLTVPLARFYCNNKDKLPTPFKAVQLDYAFRAERPQRGRNRQFVQCDIDVFGDKSVNAELELIKTAIDTYEKLGFNALTIKVNSRQILNAIVLNAGFDEADINSVCVSLDKIDKISLNGVMMELIEKGFDTDKINRLVDSLSDIQAHGLMCVTNYGVENAIVKNLQYLIDTLNTLTGHKHNIQFDISIVRGQGYYTGTIYEVYTEGFSGAIGAGGRYDGMIKKFAGVDIPAVGMSIGYEPVCMLIRERGTTFNLKPNLALLYEEQDNIVEVFKIKEKLKQNYNVALYLKPKNLKNFYDKIGEVADFVTSFADVDQNKPPKQLSK